MRYMRKGAVDPETTGAKPGAAIALWPGAGFGGKAAPAIAGTPVTIDFNPLSTFFATTDQFGRAFPNPYHYVEQGLDFSTDGFGFVRRSQSVGGLALSNGNVSSTVYLRPVTADPFGVVSIDLDGLNGSSGSAVTFNFTALTAGGQTLTAGFTTDAVVGLQTYNFPPGFVDLRELHWTMSGGSRLGLFDNVVVNATETHSFAGTDQWDVMAGTDSDDVFRLDDNAPFIAGREDIVSGRGGNDVIYFGSAFVQDAVDGGAGADRVLLQGDYANAKLLSMIGVETVVLLAGSDTSWGDVAGKHYSYNLYTRDEVVAAGQLLQIDGSALGAGEKLTFNGGAERDGRFALTGGGGDDALTAGPGNDILNGGAGNDVLDGGAGADVMAGNGGDDVFMVDNAGDLVAELAGEGNDRIFASVSYALAAGAEVELLTTDVYAGIAAIDLTGNALANSLIGNDGANVLNGGAGADILVGRQGDDFYYVDNAGDRIVEAAGQGSDRIFASASYTLAADADIELLTTDFHAGTAAINLTGNAAGNTIFGNDGANILDGKAGADILVGRLGDDWYYVDSAGDRVLDNVGEGIDRLFASASYTLTAEAEVELMTTDFHAGTNAIDLTGNELANVIYGNDGINILDGRGGSDVLVGRAGGDTFAFTTALGAGNVDRLVDFAAGSDRIALDDAVFTQLGAHGSLNATAFVAGAAAADADDRIVYNSATGQLFYDADGNGAGAAVQFATLATGLSLTAGDFQVI